MQGQSEAPQPLTQHRQYTPRILFALEADDEVIGFADQGGPAPAAAASPPSRTSIRCASEWNGPSGSRCARSTTFSSGGDMLSNVDALGMVLS
jgi:hypothetical protein